MQIKTCKVKNIENKDGFRMGVFKIEASVSLWGLGEFISLLLGSLLVVLSTSYVFLRNMHNETIIPFLCT